MLLDIQNQFREEKVKSLRRDETAVLPAGYLELYKEWTQNNATLYQLSDDDFAQSFSDYIRKAIKLRINYLIENSQISPEERLKLRQFAARGQILLVSADGGQTFDKLISPDNLRAAQAATYQLLSPTFRVTTTNLREVMDEQSILHVAANLRAQGFVVQDYSVDKDHNIHMDLAPNKGLVGISIDLSKGIAEPLVYKFIDDSGREVKAVPETQLPEEFGHPPEEPSLKMPSEENLLIAQTMEGQSESDDRRNLLNAAANLVSGVNLLNAANAINRASEQDAIQDAVDRDKAQNDASFLAKTALLDGLTGQPVPNVMSAKADVNARIANQQKQLKDQQETYRQRLAKRDEESKSHYAKQEQEKKEAEERQKKQRQAMLGKGAIGAGVAGLAGSVGTGLTLFINNINNLLS